MSKSETGTPIIFGPEHLALGHLEPGDAEAAYRLFRAAFASDVHSGPPRGKVTDPVSFFGAGKSPTS